MKMNKIIIPAAALAMGVALVGSVSSTLAWYQYSTKAQAAFIGTSVGESENLEIKIKNRQGSSGFQWVSNALSTDIDKLAGVTDETQLIPVSPNISGDGSLAANAALPTSGLFHGGIETGVAGYGDPAMVASANNYIQFTLNIRYKKVQGQTTYAAKKLSLIDLTIMDNAANTYTNNEGDLYKALRVHFSAGNNNSLFANDLTSTADTIVTNTYGNLDTDNDNVLDKAMIYEWQSGADTPVMYGVENSVQTAYNSSKVSQTASHFIGNLPADEEDGLAVTVTIWIEGWQKLAGIPANNAQATGTDPVAAMWDPAVYHNKKFNIGMRFQAEDIPAQNP